MTIREITQHRAGPELDRLIHERVMGYTPCPDGGWWTQDGEPCPTCWGYSTSGTWSMIVAETLVAAYHANRWGHFALRTVNNDAGRGWHAMFRRGDETAWAEGETPEEAICLAALIAATAEERSANPKAPSDNPVAALRRTLWDPRTPETAHTGQEQEPSSREGADQPASGSRS